MTRLIVAEKPSQARSIAEALGISGRGEGFLGSGELLITWCIGHLVELAPPEDYDPAWERWSLESLPIMPQAFKTRPVKTTAAQFRTVRDLMRRKDVHEIVCGTDSGREGELIFDLVLQASGVEKIVKRLWTASLTPEAIRNAYANLRPAAEFAGLRHAAHCRSQADWLVGLNATRAQTLQAQAAGGQGVWSVGRVQTPTLALLVEREKAIRSFASKPFWTLEGRFQAKNGAYEGKWGRREGDKWQSQISSEGEAKAILTRMQGQPARVESVEGREAREAPPQLFDLTSLQREANRRFGFSADKTLGLAQALYEKGILSYPRTSSRYLTDGEAEALPKALKGLPSPYGELAAAAPNSSLGKRFVDASKVEDHHAILPTGKAASLTGDEQSVFDLVARRAVGAFYSDLVLQKTVVMTRVGEERFRTTGSVVLTPGWTVVEAPSAESKDGDEDEKKRLPSLTRDETVGILALSHKEGKTQPPKPYSEADLLGAMEMAGKTLEDESLKEAMKEGGLGTPATRASVIEGLLARGYVERKGKALVPTAKGLALIGALDAPVLKSAELTGQWEAKLERVRRCELAPESFMAEVRRFTSEVVTQIRGKQVAPQARPNLGPCPKCGSDLLLKQWEGKHYAKCSATRSPDCKVAYDCDVKGKPKGGTCKACRAPMRVTKSGAKVCVLCGQWH